MAQILIRKLEDFVRYQEEVFGAAANKLQPDEVAAIHRLSQPRQTSTTRRLFFPVDEDFEDEEKKLPWYVMYGLTEKPTATSFEAWPRMDTEYHTGDGENPRSHRRPGFLVSLTDEEYRGLYERLLSGDTCDTVPPSWEHFAIESGKLGPTVSCLLHHLVWWFQPKFKKPATSNKALAQFQWVNQIADDIIRRRGKDYKKPSPQRSATTPETHIRDAKALVKEVWNLTRRHLPAMTNSSIRAWVR